MGIIIIIIFKSRTLADMAQQEIRKISNIFFI